MVLKSEIAIAYSRQQKNLANFKPPVIREYLEDWKKREYDYSASHIEVVTGVCRCGKMNLLKSILQKAKEQIGALASNLGKLNSVYGNMLSAMQGR